MAWKVAAFLAALELEDVGCELLGDGGRSLALALEVFGEGAHDADGVNGTVCIEALVLAGEDGLAEIFRNLAQRHHRALLTMDAADFLAQAITDDRTLRHLMNAREIMALGPQTIDQPEKQQRIEPGDHRISQHSNEKPRKKAERTRQQIEQMKRPKKQQRNRPGPARWRGGLAAAVVFRRGAFGHRQANAKRHRPGNPPLIQAREIRTAVLGFRAISQLPHKHRLR